MCHDIAEALHAMLGPAVGIGVTDPRAATDDLWTDERTAIARAIPKRRFEFAAGRRAARQALGELGLPAAAIPMGRDRAPVWPAGIAGSIAHCDAVCVAAVTQAYRSIGIDVEPLTDLDVDLIVIVCTKAEQRWLDQCPVSERGLHAKRIFCAKEAVYKAQFPLTGQVIGFDAVEIGFQPNEKFEATLPNLPVVSGRVRSLTDVIVTTAQI